MLIALAGVVMVIVLVFAQTFFGVQQLLGSGSFFNIAGQTSSTSISLPPPPPSAVVSSQPRRSVPVPITNLKDPSHSYGIAGGSRLAGLSEDQLAAELNDMVAMGVTWLRFDIEWSNVQPDNASQQHWNDYDKVVKAARARNVNVLAILDYTPSWARPAGCYSAQCGPRDPAEFATFATLAVNRYAPQGVHAWEVWNEPNSRQFWQPKADAGAYTRLLKAAYPAIKSADSQATILSGGLAPQSTDGESISRRDFLQCIYAEGAKGYFDAVSDHPYTFPRLPADNTDRAWSEMSTTTPSLRSLMVANGDASKKIWITEYGAPTGGPGSTATPENSETVTNTWHVTETLQANILKEAVRLYKSYDWVGPFFWYSNKDAGTTQDTTENFFGLVRADGSHKPAYDTYKQVILQ